MTIGGMIPVKSSHLQRSRVERCFFHLVGDELATIVVMQRGKVNALNEMMLDEMLELLVELEEDEDIQSVILTGMGRFFSFGFDIPELMKYSQDSFARFLNKYTYICRTIFMFPKPTIAAINGHAIASGGLLAMACDYRILVSRDANVSFNELKLGSSSLPECIEILRYCVGQANTEKILYRGKMHSANDALMLGLVHQVVPKSELLVESVKAARQMAEIDRDAFISTKRQLKQQIFDQLRTRRIARLNEFIDHWYSPETRQYLEKINLDN